MAFTNDFAGRQRLAFDTVFISRVQHAMLKAAINVQAEASNTTNHTNRSGYAHAVLNDPNRYGPLFAQGVVTNASITDTSTDSDIEFTVNSLWDAYAGVLA
jgi:hypothetical protein